MVDEGCFCRLIDLIDGRRADDRRLHRLLLELIYEMSRVERLRASDLLHVEDSLVTYLFQLIESAADDADDPYHYPVIRVLVSPLAFPPPLSTVVVAVLTRAAATQKLVLNEQYMVASTVAAVDPMSPTAPLTNRVVKILSVNGPTSAPLARTSSCCSTARPRRRSSS